MSQRYLIRVYEDKEKKGSVTPGTIVENLDRNFAVYAYSAEEVEAQLQRDVISGKMTGGRVYQISPWMGNLELIRSTAISTDGSAQRVFLDPASGMYGDLRRIRFLRPSLPQQPVSEEAENLSPKALS